MPIYHQSSLVTVRLVMVIPRFFAGLLLGVVFSFSLSTALAQIPKEHLGKSTDLMVRVEDAKNGRPMKDVRVLFTIGERMSPKHPASELKTDGTGTVIIPLPTPVPANIFVAVNDDPYVRTKDQIAACNGWEEFRVREAIQKGALGQHKQCAERLPAFHSARPVAGEITVFARSLSAIQRFLKGMQT